MKKYILWLLFAVVSCAVNAQVNSKYLQGAVPEIEGKIVFSKAIKTSSNISAEKLFDLMKIWAEKNYNSPDNPKQRVLLTDAAGRQIACKGDQDLIFKRSALSLDKAVMAYQLILQIQAGECLATVKNIKLEYNDTGKKIETLPAEDLISDRVALNGEKLNRYYDKFRIHAVDSINGIFNSIDVYLNGVKKQVGAIDQEVQRAAPAATSTEVVPSSIPLASLPVNLTTELPLTPPTNPTATLAGFKQITPDRIPGNIIKLLHEATLITSGSGKDVNVMTASWGGIGEFWEKPVSFCFLGAPRYSITTMDKGDYYTISFYTEAYKEALQYCGTTSGRNEDKIKGSGLTPIITPSGATAFSEAWMIFECKKILEQTLSHDAITDKAIAEKWNNKELHKMYIGEIVNVWIK